MNKTESTPKLKAVMVIAVSCIITWSLTPENVSGQSQQRNGPPESAFKACEKLLLNDVCTANTRRGAEPGVCLIVGRGNASACVPDSHAERGTNGARNQHPMREHTVNQAQVLTLIPATEKPITTNQFTSTIDGEWRVIKANSIASHLTGKFPNKGNPNRISEINTNVRVPANPSLDDLGVPKLVKVPGMTMEGVTFDPGAAEFYQGDRSLGWQYEALSGALSLGLDENHAHVQPSGKYHYHGLPSQFLDNIELSKNKHSPQVGWAVDGFPIYAQYGYADANDPTSKIVEFISSWIVKSGSRPTGEGNPGGQYDGTFTADYEYLPSKSVLDECNGRVTVTPEFPSGTYAYFLTSNWPVVPRCVRGKTDPKVRGGRG